MEGVLEKNYTFNNIIYMEDNNALEIVKEIMELHVQEPNDIEFGGKVRSLVWAMIHDGNANY